MRTSQFCFAVALLAALSLSFSLRAFIFDPPAIGWDEGVHLDDALTAYHHLTSGSLKDFLLYVDSPMYYPFIHSLLIALTWLITGISETGARLAGIAMSLCLVPAVVWLGRSTLPPDQRERAILLATAATLSSPELLRLQGLVMLDVTGTVATVVALITWVRWLERDTWSRAAAMVSAALATYFVKYNFGVVLGLTLLLHGIVARAGFQRLYRATLLLAAPVLLWLYQEPTKKFALLSEYLVNRTLEESLFAQLAFPIVSAVRDHAPWMLVGVVLLAAYLMAWSRFSLHTPAGVLLLLPLVQGLTQASSTAQLPRYILPAAPAMYLLAGAVIAPLATSSRRRRLADLGVVALAASILRSPATILTDNACHSHRASLRTAVRWLVQHAEREPLTLIGGFAELPPSIGRFEAVALADRRTGTDIDSRPLFLACPSAFQYTRQRLWPLTPSAAATSFCEAMPGRMVSSDHLQLAVIRLDKSSKLRSRDYVHFNEWQEVIANLIEQHSPPLPVIDSYRGEDFSVDLVLLDRAAVQSLCPQGDAHSPSGGARRR